MVKNERQPSHRDSTNGSHSTLGAKRGCGGRRGPEKSQESRKLPQNKSQGVKALRTLNSNIKCKNHGEKEKKLQDTSPFLIHYSIPVR